MKDSFAFVIHPLDPKRDVARKFPLLGKFLPVGAINFLSTFFPPLYISHITGIRSEATGHEIEGWFVACPYTPARMLSLPPQVVYRKIIQTGRLAQRLGARILGLGAYTSVVGDGGVTIARHLDLPVTTGNSYTVAVAVDSALEGARRMRIPLESATAAVVGATGSIGSVCAQMLARQVKRTILIGRRPDSLEHLSQLIASEGHRGECSTEVAKLREADIIITVTSSLEAVIRPEYLKPGAVICDVAQPRDVSAQVAELRKDVLVIDGGMVRVPGEVNFNFDFGFPPGLAYACMAETMTLALEGRYEDYTLGKVISVQQVETIRSLAIKHGFRLAGFRSFESAVTDAEIEQIRQRARAEES
jgi:fatty aldehyde-generating acyl-ACP reductase